MMYKIDIWGRAFELEASFDCFPGEEILELQRESLKRLLNAAGALEGAKEAVARYLAEREETDVTEGQSVDLFQFVTPKAIYLPRNEKKRSAAILFDCKADPEHGMAVVFENERLVQVGTEDIIL